MSPWVELIERIVEFAPGGVSDSYHALMDRDYIAIVALTPKMLIPIVRQYRPAVEAYTWELPAGLVDAGEDPAVTARRELLEETGLPTRGIHALGTLAPNTGRLSNQISSFFVETGEPTASFVPEAGISTRLVSPAEVVDMIRAGQFVSQLHLGALLLAHLRGFLDLRP